MGGSGSSLPLGAMADGSNAVAADVLFSSNDGEQLCIIHDQENWPDEGWTPIGIVVVPGTHNRYGDGSCGVMSLVRMSKQNPTGGTITNNNSDANMYIGTLNSTVGNFIFSQQTVAIEGLDYLVFQYEGGSVHDYEYRYGFYGTPGQYLQWPYTLRNDDPQLTNDPSTLYYNSGTYPYVSATSGKAGCDFNGVRNTAALYIKTRTATEWTSSEIQDDYKSRNHPAIACCGRFKTIGTNSFYDIYSDITSNNINFGTPISTRTNKGFWYFPSLGELSYIPGRQLEITNTFSALIQKYGNIAVDLEFSYCITSTEAQSDVFWVLYKTYYQLSQDSTNAWQEARAFLRF